MLGVNLNFSPKLIHELRTYNRHRFFKDLAAGITVAMVALPLSMAFAIASDAPPAAGIFTAIIAGFLISALGGSKVQIGGPAGAFIVVIYGIIERYGFANLLICTILAGFLQFIMGFFKLGSLVRFIPKPIVIGFTNGIAVLIALSQIKDLLGLNIDKMPGDFFTQILTLSRHLDSIQPSTFALAAGAFSVLFLWPRLFTLRSKDLFPEHVIGSELSMRYAKPKRLLIGFLQALPGPVIVLVGTTLLVTSFDLPVQTIGTRFGGIPQTFAHFALPDFQWIQVKQLFAPTLTIALLGAIESLLSARVADNLIDDRHDPNQELMAQGIANTVAPFFACLPATGTIARTVTNIRSGGTSPVSGMVHALTLLCVVLVAAPLAQHIPLAALAAILLFVAYNMGEWHEFIKLRQFSLNYRAIMLGTFSLTVIFDLTVAVEVGLLLACVFFIYRVSSITTVTPITPVALQPDAHPDILAYKLFGSLFFGAVDKLEQLCDDRVGAARVVILEMHQVINIDTTGIDALEGLLQYLNKRHAQLLLCGLNKQPASLVRRSGLANLLGEEHCAATLEEALERAREWLRKAP